MTRAAIAAHAALLAVAAIRAEDARITSAHLAIQDALEDLAIQEALEDLVDLATLYGDGRPSPRGLLSTQTTAVNRPADCGPDSRQVRRAKDRAAHKTSRT